MRERFNRGDYYNRMKNGEFTAVKTRIGKPRDEILHEYGPDTLSASVSYRNQNGDEIVRVHQYESPNGEILYKDENGVLRKDGLPDPKVLFEDGILYHLPQKRKTV